jgi:hypothetical protein
VLDPRVHGEVFSAHGICQVRGLLFDVAQRVLKRTLSTEDKHDLIHQFQDYRMKKACFRDHDTFAYMRQYPVQYWQECKYEASLLSKIACAVLEYCSHVASCEGVWSDLGLLHTTGRYNLSEKTTSEMSRVKFHYRRILHAIDGSRTAAAVAKKYRKLLRDIETMTAQFLFGPEDSGSTKPAEDHDTTNDGDS